MNVLDLATQRGREIERRRNAVAIGERVKRLRLELGLSQRQLAEGLDHCTYCYVSRIESGDRYPSARVLRQLAERLETTELYLETGRHDDRCPYCGRGPT